MDSGLAIGCRVMIPRGKRLFPQTKEIVNAVYNYFAQLERHFIRKHWNPQNCEFYIHSLAQLLKALRPMCIKKSPSGR